ncbi:MAG TPA: dockerin type I domain-containing protein, partial [Phycisphaerae bacterium]|nr:dockerin type I domain-containing protein [Phycisphaerae bacterium]
NKDGAVNTADASSVKSRLGQSGAGANVPYDIDRDCSITTADQSSVKGRLGNLAPAPCPCP